MVISRCGSGDISTPLFWLLTSPIMSKLVVISVPFSPLTISAVLVTVVGWSTVVEPDALAVVAVALVALVAVGAGGCGGCSNCCRCGGCGGCHCCGGCGDCRCCGCCGSCGVCGSCRLSAMQKLSFMV